MGTGAKGVEWKRQEARDIPDLLVCCTRAGPVVSPVPNTALVHERDMAATVK